MAAEKQGITYIGIEHIHPHPENPRKDLGNLEELAESLKKNGVMQNLTVVPVNGQQGEYYTLIGNRRHGAAKLAGITELPCRVVKDMSRKEQLSTMLEENMQRSDLTIFEQAQGFQLMLDLGETEDTIAEKTGFSKSTIRHRLNIAKLDQKELKKREQEDGFQMTLKDLYELEKVKDVKTRNKILKEARDSREIASRAKSAAEEQKREENAKQIKKTLTKLGVKAAPKNAENEMYTGKWKTVKEFELDKDAPKQIILPNKKEPMYYLIHWRTIKVIMKAPKEKRELSEWEMKQKEMDKAKKQIKAILKESSVRRKEFIQDIISGKIEPVKDEKEEMCLIWQAYAPLGTCIYNSTLYSFFAGKNYYACTEEEKQEVRECVDKLSVIHQMLIVLHDSMTSINETFDYNLKFSMTKAAALLKGYKALKPYGWFFESEDEKKVLDGTYELYFRENENKTEG